MNDVPFLRAVRGEVSADGRAVGLRIERFESETFDLGLAMPDVQSLVTLLFVMAIEAANARGDVLRDSRVECVPLPVRAVSVGEAERGQICLRVEVGTIPLMLCLNPDGARELGETLFTVAASRPKRAS